MTQPSKLEHRIVAMADKIVPGFRRVTGWVNRHKRTIALTAGGLMALYGLYYIRKTGYDKAMKELHISQQKLMAETRETNRVMFKPELDIEVMNATNAEFNERLRKKLATMDITLMNIEKALKDPNFIEWLKLQKGIKIKKVR